MIKKNQKTNKLVAIYGRVSSSNQENEGTIETQLSAINELIKEKGFTIVKKYIDEGWSGDSIVRPALDELRIDAKKKIFDAVVIYDPDRLARRYSYQELMMDELRDAGIEVIFVTTPAPKDGLEKILYGVQGLFAEYERAKIAERFRLGKIRKAKEGHIIATEAPYGYTFIPKNGKKGDPDFRQGYYEINEREAQVVRNIFSWVGNEGISLHETVRRLHKQNIQPRKSKRGVWCSSTIGHMLKNKTYIGEGNYGMTYAVVPENPVKIRKYKKTKKTSRKKRLENEWIKIPTPKIVNKDLFNKVGTQLKSNPAFGRRNLKYEYLLSGKIRCGCGKSRGGRAGKRGRYLYYRCTDREFNYPLPRRCRSVSINAKVADQLVWNKIAELMSSPKLMKNQVERWIKNQNDKVGFSDNEVDVLKKEVLNLKSQYERYNKAYGMGIYSVEELMKYVTPIKDEIQSLEDQIEKILESKKQVKTIIIPTQNDMEPFAEKARKKLKGLSFDSRRAVIIKVIDKIVGTPERLDVRGYIPLTLENNVALNTSDANGQYPMRHTSWHENEKVIPFSFNIKLPPPLKQRPLSAVSTSNMK